MPARTTLLLTLALAGCGPWLLACQAQPPPPPAESAEAPRPAVLPYVEQLTGGAQMGDRLPLIVTMHGRGGTPETFQRFFEQLEMPARVIHLEAPVDEGNGRAWFNFRHTPQGLTDLMANLADRATETALVVAREKPTIGKPLLTGFSQGAMLVYVALLRHPDAFAQGLPVSGVLFNSFMPPDGTRLDHLPPIVAFHGEADPIIGVAQERRTIDRLRGYGANAELRTFPDIPHWIMGSLREAFHTELTEAAARSEAATRT